MVTTSCTLRNELNTVALLYQVVGLCGSYRTATCPWHVRTAVNSVEALLSAVSLSEAGLRVRDFEH